MCGRKEEEEEEDGTCSPTQMREKRHVCEWLCCMEFNDWLLAVDRYQRGIHHIALIFHGTLAVNFVWLKFCVPRNS